MHQSLQEELISMRLREEEDACALDCYRSRGNSSSTDIAKVQGGISRNSHQENLLLSEDLRESQVVIGKLKEQLGVLQNENTVYQEKLDEISTDMNLLLRMIPSWENTKEIAESPILFILAMAKRILAGTKEGEMDLEGCSMQADTNIDISKKGQLKLELTCSSLLGNETASLNDPDKENTFAGTTDIPKIIRHYLKTIQGLEKKLTNKERELRGKNQALKEVQDDLARDEKIFSEKMKEIKALKHLTRELTVEKDFLIQKVQMDATIIADLSHNALAKEDELSRLRASTDFLCLQPQENDGTFNKGNLAVSSKNGHHQLCSVLNHPIKEHLKPDLQERDEGELDETQKAHDETAMSKQLRPIRDKANKKLPINFDKRFQELMHNILKGGQLNQKAGANESQAMDNVPNAINEVDIEVPFNDMNVIGDENHSKFGKQDIISQEDLCNFFFENKETFQRPGEGLGTEELHPGLGLSEFSQNEEDGLGNLVNLPQDFHHVGPKDKYLEKKLTEITLAWHAEKQAMEEMVQAERETWETRAMYAVRKQEQLERDHQALKEELENTKSLMQKAGLGIRLSAHNVRELTNGDVDLRTSITC